MAILISILLVCYFNSDKSCANNNKYEKEFNKMLQWFEDLSTKYNINYSLAYGTLLGYIRNKNYIPYDGDADLLIGKEDAIKIIDLINGDTIIYNSDIRKLEDNKIYIIINRDHNKKMNNRHRFNCRGKEVKSQIDACSFNGLFGRIIYNNAWVDLYVYSNKNIKNEYTDHCRKETGCAFTSTELGTTLPETKRVKMNNITTRIFKSDKFINIYLIAIYGNNYIIPDHKCYNGKWI